MDKDKLVKGIEQLKKDAKKRKFLQTVDFIVTLKNLNLKKPEEQIDLFVSLPFSKSKKVKICAFVGPELKEQAAKVCDKVIALTEFDEYKDKNKAKKVGEEYDFFIAQMNIMPKVAQIFGRILGPKGKMPNPKGGQVVPPTAALQPIYDRLQKTTRLTARTSLMIQTVVGDENMSSSDLADNILALYKAIVQKVENEQHYIKSRLIKLSMSKPIRM